MKVQIMNIREKIVSKVQNLPDGDLLKVYEFVEQIDARIGEEQLSLMQRLRKIKIQGPPDFSRNLDLYMSGERKMDENID